MTDEQSEAMPDGKEVEAEPDDVEATERWHRYRLEDGTVIQMKNLAMP